MSINFLETSCKQPSKKDALFGICDDQNGTEAYIDIINPNKWVAIVSNKDCKEVAFIPIDNCILILKPDTKSKESTCDAMLTFTDSLYLVELKVQGSGGWKSIAIGQLENTMKLRTLDEQIQKIRYKKAFVCNKKYPYFQETDNEQNLRFFRKFGFRIHVGTDINL